LFKPTLDFYVFERWKNIGIYIFSYFYVIIVNFCMQNSKHKTQGTEVVANITRNKYDWGQKMTKL